MKRSKQKELELENEKLRGACVYPGKNHVDDYLTKCKEVDWLLVQLKEMEKERDMSVNRVVHADVLKELSSIRMQRDILHSELVRLKESNEKLQNTLRSAQFVLQEFKRNKDILSSYINATYWAFIENILKEN